MIINGEITCENCSHRNVCKVKELFESTKFKVDDLSASILDIFEISFKCKEFRADGISRTINMR